MRLIDADALIESICHTADLGGWIGDTLRNIKRLAVRYINETPSIDIVRCKECVKANTKDCSHSYWDDDWGVWRIGYKGDDWFCADGEREGE